MMYPRDTTASFWMRRRISIRGRDRPSVRPSVGPVLFSNDDSVFSYVLMTMKFDMDQETVKNNS